jgi:hypothetical protein
MATPHNKSDRSMVDEKHLKPQPIVVMDSDTTTPCGARQAFTKLETVTTKTADRVSDRL